jgi:hypothetical protein
VFVSVERQTLAEDLWEYGEDELAHHALTLSDPDLGRVGVLAGRILLSDEYATPSGASPMLSKACALAAVEVVEGRRRPLARRRRRIRDPDRRSQPGPATAAPTSNEQPRQVYIAACEAIASHFEDRGFRFAKSGPHMSRRSDPFKFVVSFGSSPYNTAGVSVTVEVYAHVHSATLRAWRKARDLPGDDYLAAGNLGNLRHERAWLDWDVGRPETRDDVIAEVVAAIESIAVPYFERFEDEERFVQLLESGGMPGCAGLSAIEWLLATGRQSSAVRHGHALLATEEWLPRSYQREVKRYETEGIDRGPYAGLAEGLAYATVAFGLNFNGA